MDLMKSINTREGMTKVIGLRQNPIVKLLKIME